MAIYKITTKATVSDENGAKFSGAGVRLVDAKTKAQALAHVVADTIDAEVCDTADAVRLGAAGVKVEKAGEVVS